MSEKAREFIVAIEALRLLADTLQWLVATPLYMEKEHKDVKAEAFLAEEASFFV